MTSQPGLQHTMRPQPESLSLNYKASNRLAGKVAVITGADSGIGRAVALHFVAEGIQGLMLASTLHEKIDMERTIDLIKQQNRNARILIYYGDFATDAYEVMIDRTVEAFGRIDILVSNAGEQFKETTLAELDVARMEHLFKVNFFPSVRLAKAAEPHMPSGSSIIITTSVNAYKGNDRLIDYTASKGALTALIRSLALILASKGIRVNGVAPGPIWTPLITSSLTENIEEFGKNTAMGRCGQPSECGASYVFLADNAQSSYFTGQVLHPNGGYIVNA